MWRSRASAALFALVFATIAYAQEIDCTSDHPAFTDECVVKAFLAHRPFRVHRSIWNEDAADPIDLIGDANGNVVCSFLGIEHRCANPTVVNAAHRYLTCPRTGTTCGEMHGAPRERAIDDGRLWRVFGGVQPPRPVRRATSIHTPAKDISLYGTIDVDRSGRVIDLNFETWSAEVDALRAEMTKWHFEPATFDGMIVASRTKFVARDCGDGGRRYCIDFAASSPKKSP
ncbi:MAG TPA: hypothetical protein VMU84_11100 [Thermoanaerobaculia bacterium]|nr:hypothetical protein [Thermoanaerobaculia bacterium]